MYLVEISWVLIKVTFIISDDIREPIDFPFTLDEIKAEGYALIDGILQDPNQIIGKSLNIFSTPGGTHYERILV